MQTRTYDGFVQIRFTDSGEFASWVTANGWADTTACANETGIGFDQLRNRWFRLVVDRHGRRRIRRHSPNRVRVQA